MNNDITLHAKDLTQLSSREQLSALMDGALPADETRFLLRRLQHDATLAECWQRWRLSGEVMRGLAPAQRLPADFATRVAASLHGNAPQAAQASSKRTPAWLRWGGGAAMAASLAVAALVVRQPGADATAPQPAAVIAATTDAAPVPKPLTPNSPAPAAGSVAAAGALAALARPTRASRRNQNPQAAPAGRESAATTAIEVAPLQVATTSDTLPLMAQPDIVTRPWPRSVLPQYANPGLAVGFGNQGGASFSPFQAQAVPAPLPVQPDAGEAQPTPVDANEPPSNP